MSTQDAGGGKGADSKEPPTIESLTAQIENLNKGIAGYRDEAATAKKEAAEAKAAAKTATEAADAIKKAIDEAKDDSGEEDPKIKLSPSDQKRLDNWAKGQGFVTKEEMAKEQQRIFAESMKSIETQAVNEFLEKHPDINSDDEWKKIGEQFALYKQPTNLTGYRQLLNKIYKDLYGSDEAAAKARAEIETRKRLALGGGNQKDSDDKAQIDDYAEKYPHLSREQIVARVKEINDLADSRAKQKKDRESKRR